MTTPPIKAYPGCYIVTLLEEAKSTLVLTGEKQGRILHGVILDVGEPMEQKSGGVIKPKLEVGDEIFFLSYSGDYDWVEYDNIRYYCVLVEDGRAQIKHE